jgi:hypothetical protein
MPTATATATANANGIVSGKEKENQLVNNIKLYVETPSTIMVRETDMYIENINRLTLKLTNPFKKEDISYITLRDVALIFNNAELLPTMMKYYLYEVENNNINFYKENEDDVMIKVLIAKGKIIEMTHTKFLDMMNVNIAKHCLSLLSKYHKQMTIIQLESALITLKEYKKTLKSNYLKSQLPCYSILQVDSDDEDDDEDKNE